MATDLSTGDDDVTETITTSSIKVFQDRTIEDIKPSLPTAKVSTFFSQVTLHETRPIGYVTSVADHDIRVEEITDVPLLLQLGGA